MKTTIRMKEEEYTVLVCENEYIFHPSVFGICPVWSDSSPYEYDMEIILENYKVSLNYLWVSSDCAYPLIHQVFPKPCTKNEMEGVEYNNLDLPITYSGTILLTKEVVNDYGFEEVPCYGYKKVLECVFENGILITTVDHSKAMLRIRKNLDLGYRNLDIRRDERCINHFLKTSLIGKYRLFRNTKRRQKYLNDMKLSYQNNPSIA